MRGIYYYHTQVNGWNDIGYNFLIDRFGTIYEGRYGGVAKAVRGAQVLGFNSWSTGVALIGTFETVAPSAAAVTSLERLLSWKLDLSHLDPLGTARIQCSTTEMYKAGQWVTVPVILGHRQVNYTECPGNVLFGMLPAIRAVVNGLGDPKIFAPAASPAAFSPNGDGVRDTVTLKAGLSGSDDWTIDVSDAAGAVVAHFAGTGTTAKAVWDGRDDAGKRLAGRHLHGQLRRDERQRDGSTGERAAAHRHRGAGDQRPYAERGRDQPQRRWSCRQPAPRRST